MLNNKILKPIDSDNFQFRILRVDSFAIWLKQRFADQNVGTGRFRTGPDVKTKLSATYFLLGVHSHLLVVIAESGVDSLAFVALLRSFQRTGASFREYSQ